MSKEQRETLRLRALIIRNAQAYDFGGGERFPVDLAVQLQEHGVDPVIVSRSPRLLAYATSHGLATVRGWWWRKQQWSGRHIIYTPIYFLWQIALTFWYLALIISKKPDLVHPQSKDDFIAATVAARILRRPVIWTDHADLKYVFQNHTVWYKNPVGKLVYLASRSASVITLVSHSEARLIAAALGIDKLPSRFKVIHNGINSRTVSPAGRPDEDMGALVYCATSRLVKAKGISELIGAFKKLHALHPDTRLWLVGDGPDMAEFQSSAAGDTDITFLGHQDKPLPFVAAADVFVHPSYHEGFSLSLIEAAMLGKPIIACDVGGNPEIIRHQQTGLLVPARDADRLYDSMLQLYEDRQLATRLGMAAREAYLQEFQFDHIVAERFVPLYFASRPTKGNTTQ